MADSNIQANGDGSFLRDEGEYSLKETTYNSKSRRRWRIVIIILVVVAATPACYVAALLIGFRITSDPEAVREATKGICDIAVPESLSPTSTSSNLVTGLVRVQFESRDGNDYLSLVTRPGQHLQFRSTLRDAYDRGVIAAGGTPESPSLTENLEATIRDQPAEFVIETYSAFETVSGFFQGKESAVFLDAKFGFATFPKKTSRKVLNSLGPDGGSWR